MRGTDGQSLKLTKAKEGELRRLRDRRRKTPKHEAERIAKLDGKIEEIEAKGRERVEEEVRLETAAEANFAQRLESISHFVPAPDLEEAQRLRLEKMARLRAERLSQGQPSKPGSMPKSTTVDDDIGDSDLDLPPDTATLVSSPLTPDPQHVDGDNDEDNDDRGDDEEHEDDAGASLNLAPPVTEPAENKAELAREQKEEARVDRRSGRLRREWDKLVDEAREAKRPVITWPAYYARETLKEELAERLRNPLDRAKKQRARAKFAKLVTNAKAAAKKASSLRCIRNATTPRTPERKTAKENACNAWRELVAVRQAVRSAKDAARKLRMEGERRLMEALGAALRDKWQSAKRCEFRPPLPKPRATQVQIIHYDGPFDVIERHFRRFDPSPAFDNITSLGAFGSIRFVNDTQVRPPGFDRRHPEPRARIGRNEHARLEAIRREIAADKVRGAWPPAWLAAPKITTTIPEPPQNDFIVGRLARGERVESADTFRARRIVDDTDNGPFSFAAQQRRLGIRHQGAELEPLVDRLVARLRETVEAMQREDRPAVQLLSRRAG